MMRQGNVFSLFMIRPRTSQDKEASASGDLSEWTLVEGDRMA